jgi:hypothetical protein
MKNFFFYFLLLTLFGCTTKDPILGTWERFGDYDPGMRIKITQNEYSINAEIIKPADNDTLFAVGDIKWKNIIKVGKNKYEFGNLTKYEYQFGSLFENKYQDAYLTISNDTIKMRLFSKGNEIGGTEQPWKRVKE